MDAERRRKIIIALYIFFVHRHFLVTALAAEAIIYYSLSLKPKTKTTFSLDCFGFFRENEFLRGDL